MKYQLSTAPDRIDPGVVLRIRDRIADLIEPSTTQHTQWLPSDDASCLVPRVKNIEHPSLIDQLRDCFPDGASGTPAGVPSSRPAANLETISALGTITTEASRWVAYGLRCASSGVVSDLALLRDRASTIVERGDLADLDWHVRRWWGHARIITTWDQPPLKPHVPCDECGAVGSLRVQPNPTTAMCFECGSVWDESTIGILGNHVQIMLDPGTVVAAHVDRLPAAETQTATHDTPVARIPDSLRGLLFDV